MLAASFKRTKIVATIGPASRSPQKLQQLMMAGVNGIRLNFSHGTQEEHLEVLKTVRGLSDKLGRPAAIIADLSGPKIRVGDLPADGLPFVRGKTVQFEYGNDYVSGGVIPVQHDISKYVKPGERIFLRDGQIEVQVDNVSRKLISCKVISPGVLYSHQGINLPDTDLGGEIMTPKDLSDLAFAVTHDVDYVALSFAQTAADVERLRTRLKRLGSHARIIVKVETRAAVENIEEIIRATDIAMVARGDLAVETMQEAVPALQRRIIDLCRQHCKGVIVATQMLESMIESPQPTRAEVSDVATAVIEGADAVMLSGETAVGQYPVEAVQMMKRVILYTEREDAGAIDRDHSLVSHTGHGNAISAATVLLAQELPARAIIAETSTGQTARNIAALRPKVPIIMLTNTPRAYHQLAIIWGGKSYYHGRPSRAVGVVVEKLREAGNVKRGDLLVLASGHQPGVAGGTDTVSVRAVD